MVVGLDSVAGGMKFAVPVEAPGIIQGYGNLIVAGDGYAYLPYKYFSDGPTGIVALMRVGSGGDASMITVFAEFPTGVEEGWTGYAITNADQGVLLSWESDYAGYLVATAGAGGGGVASLPALPYQGTPIQPMLQAQDGSYVGTYYDLQTSKYDMVAFDAEGGVRWTVENEYPQIALADGGVIAIDGDTGDAITFDQNGNATGMTAMPTQSWTGNEYVASGSVNQVALNPYFLGVSFWAQAGGQYSPGVGFIPIDSITTYAVNGNAFGPVIPSLPALTHTTRPHDANTSANGILSKTRWKSFRQSNCNAVFAKGLPPIWGGGPTYLTYDSTMKDVQQRQSQLNFYDTGNPDVANLTVSAVTAGLVNNPAKLPQYLSASKAVAATPLFGRPGPILLEPGFFNPQTVPYPQFILIHEVLLHAYAGVSDDAVYSSPVFAQNGLWNDGKGSTNISTWMGTDCKCTPGNPNAPACQPDTAKW